MLIEAELSVNKATSIRKVEDEVVSRIKNNPREFYRYAKSKTQVRNIIGPLKENDQNINSDESKMASILSKQYESVFSVPQVNISNMNLGDISIPDDRPILSKVTISEITMSEAIDEIPNNSVPGPDGIAPPFIKKGGQFVIDAISDILNDYGYIPGAQSPLRYLDISSVERWTKN